MTPLEHAAAAADRDLHPDARAAALDALCASVREGLGYRLPDGTVTRLWREARRSWVAAATGRTPGQAGRPRTRAPVERRPKPGRPPGRLRVPLSLRVLPEVAAALRADQDGPSRAVERMVMESAPENTAARVLRHVSHAVNATPDDDDLKPRERTFTVEVPYPRPKKKGA